MSRMSLVARIIARPRRNAAALFLSALMLMSAFAVLPVGATNLSVPGTSPSAAHTAAVGHTTSTAPVGYHLGHAIVPLNSYTVARDGPKTPFTLASHSGASTPAGRPLAQGPLTSTTSNYDILGSTCSFGGSIAQAGANNQTLIAATSNWYDVFNGTGGNPCILNMASPSQYMYTYGTNIAYRSTNGGVTWSQVSIPGNTTHWKNSSDVANGSVSYSDAFDNLGGPSIAAANNGVVLYASSFAQPCMIVGGIKCNSTANTTAPIGVALSRSVDGGATFSPDNQVFALPMNMNYILTPAQQTNCMLTSPFEFRSNWTENLHVAYDSATNVGIVTWDVIHWSVDFNSNPCVYSLNSTTPWYSLSTNGGLTWGAPVALATDKAQQSPTVAFGPAPYDKVYIMADDFGGSTRQTSGNIQLTFATWTSVDNGTTFTSTSNTGVHSVNLVAGVASPDAFIAVDTPSLAVDNWSASPHVGTAYVVYMDNQTGAGAGYSTIMMMSKLPGTSVWNSPVQVAAAGNSITYYYPAVSVAATGTIWVTYLGESSSGNYREFGTYSTDGGATWSSQFPIGDTVSNPGTLFTIGESTGVAATSNGAYAIWPDCRSAVCGGTGGSTDIYTELFVANIHQVQVSASIAGITAQVSNFGVNSALVLPASQGWDNGSSHTVTVPVWVPDATNSSAVDSFQNYSGVVFSTNYTTTFTYTGHGALVVNYKAVPAAWISGTFSPNLPTARLMVDNQYQVPLVVVGGVLTYNFTVASGATYTLSATAPRYAPLLQSTGIPTTPHRTAIYNVVLPRLTGTISGRVVINAPPGPSSYTLTVNSTVVTPNAQGIFSVTVGWGGYWVNATSPGKQLTPFSNYYQVTENAVTTVNIGLSGGWINGTVLAPTRLGASFRLSIDGFHVNVSNGGAFTYLARGGLHNLTASQNGYNQSVIRNIPVTAGFPSFVNVSLTNKGWLPGQILPTAALAHAVLTIANKTAGTAFYPFDAKTGAFNATLIGGYNYTVNITSLGYVSFQTVEAVSAGNTSAPLAILLSLAKNNTCTPPNCPGGGGGGGGGTKTGFGGLTTTDWLIVILVLIVIVAVIAAALLMRRRGDSTTYVEPQPMEEQTIYGESNPSDLPRLQSDGTMGPGNQPPPQ